MSEYHTPVLLDESVTALLAGNFSGKYIDATYGGGGMLDARENGEDPASAGVEGILADLGVSSHQFDTAERGFSFRFDAPLDMRMNTEAELTAADVVNTYSKEDLERILRIYGEVDNAGKLARLIT